MARSEARINVAIWRDQDYRTLSFGAQWMYECLVSQSDLSYAGVLALRESRWARYASDLDATKVNGFLAELSARRYIVTDDATEEILVRSFMRHDEVWKQPNVLRAAQRALGEIESPAILSELVPEVERMASLEGITERVADILGEMLETLRGRLKETLPPTAPNPSPNPSGNPSPNPISQDLKTEGGGGSVTEVGSDSPLPSPPSIPPSAGTDKPRRRSRARDPKIARNAGEVVGAYVEAAVGAGHPRPGETLRARVGKQARTLLADPSVDFDLVMEAAREMGRRGWHDLEVQMQRSSAERTRDSPAQLPDEQDLEREWKGLRS